MGGVEGGGRIGCNMIKGILKVVIVIRRGGKGLEGGGRIGCDMMIGISKVVIDIKSEGSWRRWKEERV